MPSPVPFGTRLRAAMDSSGPLCVGIDPHPGLLEAWGLPNTAEGVRVFSLTVVEAMTGVAAILKPQVALYERFGSAGFAALEETLQAAKAANLLTLADAKRGDIGSTMAAYATAWLDDSSPLASDAVTLSPYLGYESLRPAIDLAAATGRGVFVLGLTSNPEGASVQHVGGDKSVAKSIIEQVSAENADAEDLGHVGLVVGATIGDAPAKLGIDLSASKAPLLTPGLGAQGATAQDIATAFASSYRQVLGTSSRDILKAGPDVNELRDKARSVRDELLAAK
ncbi:orotidine-5'-phosphate decarboxylase [Glutamicibacter soli]|uniref:Orotidine 5'-phosphate decarboxylase n=1 Tax=Glutamicibacter soli TaxID=453836 RepID=A0A365YMC2_9MICC|nr:MULTISPECIES: orotidine-5'-phosphate decarboxylase [Micrococcaceae]ALD63971.1 orotidine 5'-phosphate decarboxylase [Arthrobacter sp. LS16]ALQ30730.1 orotidine 5'-phosphate decarboxylase [Arthrobacter sp. YC-RL1]KLI87990.1 orotidine 5'-phosphate decarboxylase [Arthrobacter sp. YC-RL1]RBM03856.1 orotidine-5'-phosphate decarboxylase [Glutamicibacter soli]